MSKKSDHSESMLVSSSAAQLRETIVKRVALEFKNGMYGILLFYEYTLLLRIIYTLLESYIILYRSNYIKIILLPESRIKL